MVLFEAYCKCLKTAHLQAWSICNPLCYVLGLCSFRPPHLQMTTGRCWCSWLCRLLCCYNTWVQSLCMALSTGISPGRRGNGREHTN